MLPACQETRLITENSCSLTRNARLAAAFGPEDKRPGGEVSEETVSDTPHRCRATSADMPANENCGKQEKSVLSSPFRCALLLLILRPQW